MRLICPNCGAQYAVADDVIPPGGRDVQCSNCAHTWFETPGASSEDGAAKPRRARPEPTPAPAERIEPAPQPPSERRKVDPSVADILREEAARETQKRQSETPAAPVESQSDLGLSDPPRKPRPPAPPAEAREAAEVAAASVGAVAGSATPRPTSVPTGREKLPDIEEINSSLNSDGDADGDGTVSSEEEEAQKRRGFRRSFLLVLLIFAALTAIYVQSDAIKTAMPALSGVIDSYVSTVDAGRVWLDDTVRGAFAYTPETDG